MKIKTISIITVGAILCGALLFLGIYELRKFTQAEASALYVIGAYGSPNDGIVPIEIHTTEPIILALTAYDTVRWAIHPDSLSQIKEIHVGGIESQQVEILSPCEGEGLSKKTKLKCFIHAMAQRTGLESGNIDPVIHHTPQNNPHKQEKCYYLPEEQIYKDIPGIPQDDIFDENSMQTHIGDCPLEGKNFFAYDTGETMPKRRGFALRGTEKGLELIEDPMEVEKLDREWATDTGKNEQENHAAQYAQLKNTLKEITGMDITYFGGAEKILSAKVLDEGITVEKAAESTREGMLTYIAEYNAKFEQRQKDLLSPLQEEDKPSAFSFDRPELQGYANDYQFTFGKYGYVYDLDAFLHIPNIDLNGGEIGMSARLSKDVLPDYLSLKFSRELSEDKENLTLSYQIKNTGSEVIDDMGFIFFIDPEIVFGDSEETKNADNRTDEYGEFVGVPGKGSIDQDPDSWEIDERGFVFGNIVDNAKIGILDNENGVKEEFHDDPSSALGFDIGTLLPGEQVTASILLSTKDESIGSLHLQHKDKRLSDILTLSGQLQRQ